jgi:hypothetical protein
MTTVKEFKEWLNQFDDDTIMEINGDKNIILKSKEDVSFAKMKGFEFADYRDNHFVKKESWWFGKQILSISDENN